MELVTFIVALAVVIVMILSKKFNPSFCLFCGAIVAAIVGGIPIGSIAGSLNSAFGTILIATGILMLFAFIFTQYLDESGGIYEFAKALVRLTGAKYDLIAVAIIGYILAIPVGFLAACAIVIPMFRPMSQMTSVPFPHTSAHSSSPACSPPALLSPPPAPLPSQDCSVSTLAGT